METSSSTLIGVGIAILSNSIVALGMNFLKLAHSQLQSQLSIQSEIEPLLSRTTNSNSIPFPTTSTPPHRSTRRSSSKLRHSIPIDSNSTKPKARTDRAYLNNGIWWIGQTLMSTGELGNFLAYAFAPASLIAPLGSTALLANAFLSPLLLKEQFKKTDLIGIGCIALGSLTVIFSTTGGGTEKILTPEQVLLALETTSTLIFVIISSVLGIGLAALSATSIGDDYVMVDVSVSALAGGFTVLATKAFSSFLNRLFLKTFKYWITYPILLVLIISALIQVNYINKGLQRFEARAVVPAQFFCFSICAITGAAAVWREFDSISKSALLNFLFGFTLELLGVIYLTSTSTETLDSTIPFSTPPSQYQSLPNDLLEPTTPILKRLKSQPNLNIRGRTVSNVTLGSATGHQYLFAGCSPNSVRVWSGDQVGDQDELDEEEELTAEARRVKRASIS